MPWPRKIATAKPHERPLVFGLNEEEIQLARECALEAVKLYGDEDGPTHQRILKNGIWNDHVAVQSAIRVIKKLKAKEKK